MKKTYGKFCGQHNQSVNYFKDLYTKDKRFQAFVKVLAGRVPCSELVSLLALARARSLGSSDCPLTPLQKKMSSSVVRRLGIPECILLVTQRITKYPVLLQRILQCTKGESPCFCSPCAQQRRRPCGGAESALLGLKEILGCIFKTAVLFVLFCF